MLKFLALLLGIFYTCPAHYRSDNIFYTGLTTFPIQLIYITIRHLNVIVFLKNMLLVTSDFVSFLKMLGSANKHFIRIFFTVLLAAAVLKFVLHSRHINVFFSVLCLWEFLVNTSIQYGTQLLKPVGQLGGTY